MLNIVILGECIDEELLLQFLYSNTSDYHLEDEVRDLIAYFCKTNNLKLQYQPGSHFIIFDRTVSTHTSNLKKFLPKIH